MPLTGFFLLADDNTVCFSRIDGHRRIKSLRLVPSQLCLAVLDDDTEDMFVHEMDREIWQALCEASDILVAHIDANGQPIEEYRVPVAIAS
jgi:hypothetical protein